MTEEVRNTIVLMLKKSINSNKFDYLLNWSNKEYSIVHIIENEKEIDFDLDGWHIWIFEKLSNENPRAIQIINDKNGKDYHYLTEEEEYNLLMYFGGMLLRKKK